MKDENRDQGISTILRAASFAAEKHRTQRRADEAATPYINHVIAVATILAIEGGITDVTVLAAALLHDTVEDTDTTIKEVEVGFGRAIAAIVAEVTDDKSLPKVERKRLQVVKAASKSDGAKLVKLADKIANLRDIRDDPPADWDTARRKEYFRWAACVVAGLRRTNPALEAAFDDVFNAGPSERDHSSANPAQVRSIDDAVENFFFAAQRAIGRFAHLELARLAKQVRDDVQLYPPSGIDGDYEYRNLWDEYCREIADGPSMAESAWEQTLQPHITHRVGELPHPTAVLLTIAAQWDEDDFEYQEGGSRDDDRIYRAVELATKRIADEQPSHLTEDLDEMDEREMEEGGAAPSTKEGLLDGCKFEDLSAAEREQSGNLHQASSDRTAQSLVANLNRNVLERHRKQRLAAKIRHIKSHPSHRAELELLELGMLAISFHVEAGIRKFVEVASVLSNDLEMPLDEFKRHLPAWYVGVQAARLGAGQDVSGMDATFGVEAVLAAVEEI